jgi:general secretion pathway protein L
MPREDRPLSGNILIRRGGREGFLRPLSAAMDKGTEEMGRLPVALRLPTGAMLERSVVLPLAAERDLSSAIGFEMDRLTPFTAEEVVWGISDLRRDRKHARLGLTLSVLPRTHLRDALARLDPFHLKPDRIESGGGWIDLVGTRRNADKRIQGALFAVSAVLALAALLMPVARQQIAFMRVADRRAALAPLANEALHLRTRLTIAASGQSEIATAQRGGDVLRSLAALTNVLPDGTWLGDLSLHAGELTIDGQSSNAAKLITLLSGSPDFSNPSFTAPVTRSLSGAADVFSIHASVGR